jgi:hypothetical protein
MRPVVRHELPARICSPKRPATLLRQINGWPSRDARTPGANEARFFVGTFGERRSFETIGCRSRD